jgi:GNAT superfamily N-acetyltransferase
MSLSIRPAVLPDAEPVAALYQRARKAAARAGSIPPPVHSDDEISQWITHVVIPKLEPWVAERSDGTIVGMLVLEDEWIDQLYVEPDLTGQGIGARLLNLAKRERPQGLRLWTFVSNLGAQRFYERHGFAELERTDGSHNEEGAPDIQYTSSSA